MLIGQEPLVPPPGVHTFPQETPAPKRVLGPGALTIGSSSVFKTIVSFLLLDLAC